MKDFIGIYRGALSKEFCNELIQLFDTSYERGFTHNRQKQGYSADKASGECLYAHYMPLQHLAGTYNTFLDTLWMIYESYASEYPVALKHSTDPVGVYEAKIQKTVPGQGYHSWHYESSGKGVSNRVLAYTAYLNDIEEGGETEFLHYNKRIRPEAGMLTFFPAGFTHLHRGNPPISNTKYIITGWFEM